jgi:hypothetical protein
VQEIRHQNSIKHEDIIVLWKVGLQIDREALANRPGIIIKKKTDKISYL